MSGEAYHAAQSPFLDPSIWVNQNDYAAAIRDIYPVSPGHTLIIPKRIVPSIFDLSSVELGGCWELLCIERERLIKELRPDGFNIGTNIGLVAGQTISHAHIHMIPRYKGDHPSPRGGVRAVIPGKADY